MLICTVWAVGRLARVPYKFFRRYERLRNRMGQKIFYILFQRDKVQKLTNDISETRTSVTDVKCFIDGMRTSRDTKMKGMTDLKTKLKDQNQRLLQVTQDKANKRQHRLIRQVYTAQTHMVFRTLSSNCHIGKILVFISISNFKIHSKECEMSVYAFMKFHIIKGIRKITLNRNPARFVQVQTLT